MVVCPINILIDRLTHQTTKNDYARMILEGCAYKLRHNMEVAQNAGVIINELRSVGSGSKSKLWNQINAAVIQTAMGWTNSHLHHFLKNNVLIY